jgi:aromatic-L-amino-acid/L-tryptophan decarboxylase
VTEGAWPLEPGAAAMRALASAVTDELVAFVQRLPDRPASDTSGAAEVIADLPLAPPEQPGAAEALLALMRRAADPAWEAAGPSYLAFIPGGGLYTAAVADFLACGLNRYTGVAATAPALVALEARLLRWLCDTFGLPEGAQGIFTSGGSLANLSATVAARADRLGDDPAGGVVYASEHAHASVTRAARLAGIPPARIRTVACTPDWRVDPAALIVQVERDRAAGLRPFLLVATAGTTNTGTIDPLPALADAASSQGLWLHVDAAYGGFFRLTERGRARLAGIDRADSITLDPHKGLFLPYGTGCLLVRDRATLQRAHASEAAYLQDLDDTDLPDFSALSAELTRDYRGLRVWLPLHLHGLAAFRAALDEKLDLARLVHDRLAADERFEVLAEPDLSVVAFRLRGGDDAANRALLARVNASQRVVLTSTLVDGRFTLRVAILAHRTHRDRIEELLAILDAAAGDRR